MSLSKKHLIFIGSIFLCLFIMTVVIQHNITLQETDAEMINVAGRQRMLSQRIAKFILLDKPNETIQPLISEWEDAHNYLYEYAIEQDYELIANQVKASREIINKVSIDFSLSDMDLFESFLSQMESIVKGLEVESKRKMNRLSIIQIGTAILIILIIGFEFLVLIKPSSKNIENQYQALEEKSGYDNTLIRQSPNSIALVDKDLVYKSRSVFWDELFDVDKTAVSLKETGVFNGKRLSRIIQNCLSGETYKREIKINDSKLILWDISPWMAGGEVNGLLINARDITLSRQLEEEVKKTSEQLKSILKSGYVSIIATDTKGVITHFSEGAERLLGYSANEMVGINTPAILHDENEVKNRAIELSEEFNSQIEGFETFILKAEEEGFESRKWTYIKKNGERFPVQLVVSPLKKENGDSYGYIGIATNISKQQEVENHLKVAVEENRRYRDIIEKVEEIIYESDGQGDFVYVNPAMCRITGYSEEELLSMNYLTLTHPESRDLVLEFYRDQAISKTEATTLEFAMEGKDGRKFWINQTLRMEFDGNRLVRNFAVVQNVTEIYELKAELEKQLATIEVREANLNALIENTTDLIHSIDLDNRIMTFNSAFSRGVYLAFNRVPEKGEKVDQYYPNNENKQRWLKNVEKAKKGEKVVSLFQHKGRDGNIYYVEDYYNPIVQDGRVIGVSVFARDVTERREKELKIDKYQDGLRLINSLAATTNTPTEDLLNSALYVVCDYLDLPLGIISKIDGKDYLIQNLYSNEETPLKQGQVLDIGDTYCGLLVKNDDFATISHMGASEYCDHPNYKFHNLESYIGANIYVGRKLYGTVNFTSSEKRNEPFDDLEKDFIVLFANWVGSVLQRSITNAKLQQEKERAELASKAKAEFLSMMSHEIRTPLNGVLGLTNILLQENPREDQIKNLNLLKFSGDNLLVIINDILDFNKIEAGKIELEQVDFNLYGILESIQQTNLFKIEDKGIQLNLIYDDKLPKIFIGDSVRLGQVINNLVSNAIKFTAKGSVTVECQLVDAQENACQILFKVIDTGKGIDNDKFDKIFEKFGQEEQSTTREYGGTGLGLPITKKLLNLMGTDIEVESELGKGSTFSFMLRLPLGDDTLLKNAQTSDMRFASLGEYNLKILVADDNEINYKVASKYLAQWHVLSEHASDGEQAVKMAKNGEYDLILMDLQMPKLDGYSATQAIREFDNRIPILALTASVLNEIKIKAKRVGMNDFVSKPMTPHQLYESVVRNLNITLNNAEPQLIHSSEISYQEVESVSQIAAGLDKLSMGDEKFFNELASLYINSLDELCNGLAKAVGESNEKLAKDVEHKAKSTLLLLGLNSVQNTVNKVVKAIGSKSSSLPDHMKSLSSQIDSVRGKLESLKTSHKV